MIVLLGLETISLDAMQLDAVQRNAVQLKGIQLDCSQSSRIMLQSEVAAFQAAKQTWTAVVVPPVHRSWLSIRPATLKALRVLFMSPCKSPMATSLAAAGRKVVREGNCNMTAAAMYKYGYIMSECKIFRH